MAAKVAWRHGRIDRVSAEKQLLLFHCLLDRNLVNDIFLSTVFHADISEPELHVLVHNHALCICSAIHNVDLSDDTYRADSLRVQLASHLQTIGCGHISVCGNDAKNDCAAVAHIAVGHCTSDFLNVFILTGDGDFCNTWQVDECQIRAGR